MTLTRMPCIPLIAALLLPLMAHAAGTSDDLARRHDAAMVEYEACHWAAAYQSFKELADAGHGQAARVALLMTQRGPTLYDQAFEASPPQRQRWAALQMPPTGADGHLPAERLASR